MGTRSVTQFFDLANNGALVVSVYQLYDGYPSKVGKEVAEFCRTQVINGLPVGVNKDNTANGCTCLAAQFIAKFKTRVGGLYIQDGTDANFRYKVYAGYDESTRIEVFTYSDEQIFNGSAEEMLAWIEQQDTED